MRRIIISLALGVLTLGGLAIFAGPASAQYRGNRRNYNQLEHRQYHRSYSSPVYRNFPYANSYSGSYGYGYRNPYRYSAPYRYGAPYGYGTSYGYNVPYYGSSYAPYGSGFGIQTPGFSLFFGR